MSPLIAFRRRGAAPRPHPGKARLQVECLEDRAVPSVDLGTTFAGLAFDAAVPQGPPDTHLAAGPRHLVEVVNTDIAFYAKHGRKLFEAPLSDFFSSVGASPDLPNGDPRVGLYDPSVSFDELSGRFIVSVTDSRFDLQTSHLLLAVSRGPDPSAGWEMHRINIEDDEKTFGDFPRLGWDADALYVTANMFTWKKESFSHVSVITIDKASVLDGDNSTLVYFDVDRTGPKHFVHQPAIMHGAAPGAPMYFVEEYGYTNGKWLNVVKMTNKLSAAPAFEDFKIDVPAYALPPDATQPDGELLRTNDNRILSVAWRDGRLLAAQTVGIDNVASVRWYEFDTTAPRPTLAQLGEINQGPGVHAYYPAIEIAPNGDVGLVFMQSSATEFLSVYVTGRQAGDPAGTMQPPVRAKAGEDTYRVLIDGAERLGPRRAGDYSGIAIDPSNHTFWAASEYATPLLPPSAGAIRANWGTWIANFSIRGGAALLAESMAPEAQSGTLDLEQAAPLLREALAPWQAAGVDVSPLGAIDIRIADLGGATLGLASGDTIWLDDNAAGWGWFVDLTPWDDAEFTTPGDQGEQHRMDLLTVLAHEIGHRLGQDHEDDGLMAETLAAGIRRTPSPLTEAGLVDALCSAADPYAADWIFAWLPAEEQKGK